MKKVKKLAGIILSLVLALTMAIPSLAANGDYKLTIKTVAGHTYKIYQLAIGDVSESGEILSNIKVGENGVSGTTEEQIKALADKSGTELGEAAALLINKESNAKAEIIGTGEKVSTTLPSGYYVIIDSYTDEHEPNDETENGTESLSRVMVTLVKDTTMTPKDSTITPDKKIVEDGNIEVDTNEASIGDTITYKLSGTLPDMQDYNHFRFVFVDTMSKGLTPQLEEGDTLYGSVAGVTGVEFKVTAVDTQDDGSTIIRIAMVNAIFFKNAKGAEVVLNIQATLNDEAVVANKYNPNTVEIDFSNSTKAENEGTPGDDFKPGDLKGTTPKIEVKTYTTSLTITKKDGEGKVLTGAEFTLTGDKINVGYATGKEYVEANDGDWYQLVDGAYTQTVPTDDTANKYADINKKYKLQDVNKKLIDDFSTAKAFVDANGVVTFTGLGAGTYTLKETTTPDGYNTIKDIKFEVTWNENTGFDVKIIDPDDDSVKISVTKDGDIGTTFSTEIVNYSGTTLPETGGIGTTIFYIVGAILVIGAGVLLIAKKRMNSQK